jgi:hypothetical protein
MNYYIQGDAANADQIKAAFKEKGFDADWCPITRELLYFTVNGRVHLTDSDNIYVDIIKTHPDYKELELPVEPKFKAGDNIKTGNQIDTIAEIDNFSQRYYCESGRTIWFENQDLWHLAPKPHYAISNLKPFDKVLVRQDDSCTWGVSFFSRYDGMFMCCSNVCFTQCIPFEGNEHLLGTSDPCDEMFINW